MIFKKQQKKDPVSLVPHPHLPLPENTGFLQHHMSNRLKPESIKTSVGFIPQFK